MSISAIMPKVWNYTVRAVKAYPGAVFGTGTERAAQVLKKTKNFEKFFASMERNSLKEMGAVRAKGGALQGASWKGFFGNFGKNLKTLLPELGKSISGGYKAGGFLGGVKGLGKGLGSKMPLIGSLMLLGFEIPNIFKATKNEGIVSGAAETVKAGARLGGAMVGAAIGQALIPIPFVGGLIGWVAGERLVSMFTGKSYSERVAKLEEKKQEEAPKNMNNTDSLYSGVTPSTMSTVPINPFAQNQNGAVPPMMGMPPLTGNWQDDVMVQNYGMNPFKTR